MTTMPTTHDEKVTITPGFDAEAQDGRSRPMDPVEPDAQVEAHRRIAETLASLAVDIQVLHQALDLLKSMQGVAPICVVCKNVQELQHASDHIKSLRSVVPICASCKKIRDDQGHWSQIEIYLRQHSETQFSHGICPECMKSRYPCVGQDAESKKNRLC
jgi:hypothetical protein